MKYIVVQFKEDIGEELYHTTSKLIITRDGTIKYLPEHRFECGYLKKRLSERIIQNIDDYFLCPVPILISDFLDLLKLKKLWKRKELENLLHQNFNGVSLIYYREF